MFPDAEQFWQIVPLVPQTVFEVPAAHEDPVQQPWQQEPLWQVPPLHVDPSSASPIRQLPVEQSGALHAAVVLQATQAPPPEPQVGFAVPGWQAFPSQQPLQQVPA